jgi:hypothetical protein
MSEIFYLIRSKTDGQYLVARPRLVDAPEGESSSGFLLLFKEHFDALSYLNTHGSDVAPRFAVESIPRDQVGSILKRWGFTGVGIVQDPLLPRVEFLQQDSSL